MTNPQDRPLPLAVTMGEPAGIAVEITLKAWLQRRDLALPPFYCIGCVRTYRNVAAKVGLDVPIEAIAAPKETHDVFPNKLPVIDAPLVDDVPPGKPTQTTAQNVVSYVRMAVEDVLDHRSAGVITNPIQKSILKQAGFRFPGHTEYIGSLCAAAGKPGQPVMMLMVDTLKVVPVTIHVPIVNVSQSLTKDGIIHAATKLAEGLKLDFGIAHPRIAVAALNPHGGEAGDLGREEIDIIAPAIKDLTANGLDVKGPFPADTLFHERARESFDAALCMYHDQALIPLKTLDFDKGVNVTLGLPIVRTSPDHGTALDIAGQGKASPASLIAAIQAADRIAGRRNDALSQSNASDGHAA